MPPSNFYFLSVTYIRYMVYIPCTFTILVSTKFQSSKWQPCRLYGILLIWYAIICLVIPLLMGVQFISPTVSKLIPCLAMGPNAAGITFSHNKMFNFLNSLSFDLHIVSDEGIHTVQLESWTQNSSEALSFPLKLVEDSKNSIFHCFKLEGNCVQLWYRKLLFVYDQNMHMLRTRLSSQNLRLKHYNLFIFNNYNKLMNQVSFFLIF